MEVLQGREMPDAKYWDEKEQVYKPVLAVDFTPELRKVKTVCKYCEQSVIFVQGNKKEDSKPFFRRSPGVYHVEGCPYGQKKTLKDELREVGTLEGLLYGVKPPLAVQRVKNSSVQEGEKSQSEERPRSLEKQPRQQVPNKDKPHQRNLFGVDDLFHELKDIRSQEPSLMRKLYERIIGNVYYPYKEYSLLLEHSKKGKLRKYFYTAGIFKAKLEYDMIENKGYIFLYGKGNGSIKLRLYPGYEKVMTQLKRFRYKVARKEKKKTEFIGVLVQLRQISNEEGVTYIDLDLYDFSINHYMNS
ncbi:hypothetical protein N0B30_23045 [Bacillus subtilis]|uniref:hypothetical protein n=1 Tax=Bacillus subtilis TaxID=1423 RepID=UPI0021B0EE36|nr:hypothetical protein [Bacillus subtilis]MCT6515511.1 hypothetical protein [Bacillus subtilis]